MHPEDDHLQKLMPPERRFRGTHGKFVGNRRSLPLNLRVFYPGKANRVSKAKAAPCRLTALRARNPPPLECRACLLQSGRLHFQATQADPLIMPDPTLKLSGELGAPREFTLAELRSLPKEFQIADVAEVDPSRKGRGIWLAGLLHAVEPSADARYLTLHASADDFHASIPLSDVRERGFVIYELDGQPLPAGAGGPFRFAIRDFAACQSAEIDECANVKFVDWMEFTTAPGQDNRPHDDAEHAALHEREDQQS